MTFSLGALVGIALAAFSIFLRRRLRPLPGSGGAAQKLPSSTASQPTKPTTHLATNASAQQTSVGMVSTRWTTPTKYIASVALFLAALAVLYIGRGVIPLVITGALLALFIQPFIRLLDRLLRGRWALAVALTYIGVILFLVAVVLLVIPNLLDAVNFILAIDFQQLAANLAADVAQVRQTILDSPLLETTLGALLEALQDNLEEFAKTARIPGGGTISLEQIIPRLAGILNPLISLLVGIIFTLLIALHMSLAAPKIPGWYPDLIPEAYKTELSALGKTISQTWVSFLRGQLTLMMIVGIVTWAINAALGVRQALFLGVTAGVLELIPSLGPTLAAIPAVVFALLFGSTHFAIPPLPFALLVIGAYVLIQFLENQFLVPYVMGDAVDLPPLVVLIGALAGALAFGILGALLATPVIATGNLIFRYTYRKILEPPPLPPEPEQPPGIWQRFKSMAGRLRMPGRDKTKNTGR